ncbi:Monoglyceride lipase [Balamuthia mandrillaris]
MGGGEEVTLKEDFFINLRGQKIFTRSWVPQHVKALVFVFHGLGEHCGREAYHFLSAKLNQLNYAVFALDHYGHGRSEGERAYIPNFEHFAMDAWQYIDRVATQFPSKLPRFVFGHSMGGSIALVTIKKRPRFFAGVAMTSPAVQKGEDISFATILAARSIAKIAPRTPIQGVDPSHVSRDPEVVKKYVEDPLVFHGKMAAKTGLTLLQTVEDIEKNAASWVQIPILICQAGEDKLVNPSGAKNLYDKIKHEKKELKWYEGVYHELLHEPEREQVLNDIVTWMEDTYKEKIRAQSNDNNKKAKARL